MMTAADHLDVIDTTVQKTYGWLRDIGQALGEENRRISYQVLRAVLHTLRDRLPTEQTAHLGAQLPMLVRGLYYEGWRPRNKPEKITADESVDQVAREAMLEPEYARDAIKAVIATIRHEITPAALDKVLDTVPDRIFELIAV